MRDLIRKVWDLLDHRERRNALLLIGLMMIMGLMETIGVASVMPLIAVIANPEVVTTNVYLSRAYDVLGFSSTDDFILFLGIAVFVLVVVSLGVKATTHWALARFTQMRNYSLSSRLLGGYLGQPYTWFLNRHSADLGKSILSEVSQVVNGVLMPGMQLLANAIVSVYLVALVVAAQPVVAASALVVIGGSYSLIYVCMHRYLAWLGTERLRANRERFQVAQEALGGIKDVKVLGLESGYLRGFRRPAHRHARYQARKAIIGDLPKFALQALSFGGILAILLVLLALENGNLAAILPLMSLYAFAGSRLNPALQQVYKALTQLRFGKPALDSLHADLQQARAARASVGGRNGRGQERIELRNQLHLDGISYTYPGANSPAISKLDLTIEARTTIGLVGSTGAGKTTVVDIILGLLEPQSGGLRVDGTDVHQTNVRRWQNSLGYVPQHIFLTDDTVAANIAFGVEESDIDMMAVERAARMAELHGFVTEEMPYGYQTRVGERGVRLSGGQRQRIGIARALYGDPDVLVLDEATSALDTVTERAVMHAVHNMAHRKTIILVAHRISTVQKCDQIFVLDKGRLVAAGNYGELFAESERFRAMASPN